ncbi:MAG: sulfur carrier protein ThiS [Hyphomicrobiaceae bacterium]|nr:sulfur carrier protein ThiS [Hyphomicrobiaceae bacterium]
MSVSVNAEARRVGAGSLADVLVALGYGGQKVATALNGEFVPERMRADTPVASGDRIEVLSARQGG